MKPILIRVKCRECEGYYNAYRTDIEKINLSENCKCKGTGQQTKEIYDLRDFEKRVKVIYHAKTRYRKYRKKIPFKDYEIKKVSEITEEEADSICNEKRNYKKFSSEDFDSYWKNHPELTPDMAMCRYWFLMECNLKEDDKLVIKKW